MSDQSAALAQQFANATGEVILPAGIINIDSGIRLQSFPKGLKIRGASMGMTVLQSRGVNGYALWFDNPVDTKANCDLEISDLFIEDISGSGACASLLRCTQIADLRINRVNLSGAKGRAYAGGKVSVSQGSNLVQGVNTVWTAAMAPGIIWIAGYPQEVQFVNSANTIQLCIPWQRASVNNSPYSLEFNGNALHLEGTSRNGVTQYGSVENLKSFGCKIGVFCQGRPTGGAGVSAFRFVGGRVGGFAGNRIPNSIGAWFGSHSDTCEWDIPVNNVVINAVIEDGHQHEIINRAENDPPYCINTTSPKSAQAGTIGVYINGSSAWKCFNNYVFPKSVYQFGTGVEVSSAGKAGLIVDLRRTPSFGNITAVIEG